MKQTISYRLPMMCLFFVAIWLIVACSAQPTAAPPTATTIPSTATPTLVPATPTALPTATRTLIPPSVTPTSPTQAPTLAKDARGFSILEADHATILAQPGVSDDRARAVASAFEIAYQVVGEKLGYPEKRSRLYVYRAEEELFQDLVTTWQYPEWHKTNRAIPRMSRDFVAWIPPLPQGNVSFIAHEYSHRIIEQIAGIGSQFNYKWFDEGLAEHLGLEALAKQSPADAQVRKQQWIAQVVRAHQAGKLVRLKDLTTEAQLAGLIQAGSGNLVYPQMAMAMDFLISRHGIVPVKNVLVQVGQGVAFDDAFQKVYGFTVDAFEQEFFAYVVKPQAESGTCFTIDGQANDWQKLQPIIVDDAQPAIGRAADVRQVYATTCRGALYLMIVTDGPADLGGDIEYAFHVDLTGDDKPEYQPGFARTRAWLWNLKGTGYADAKSNLKFLSAQDYKVAIGAVAEFMLPLSFLENATSLRIRVYTVVSGQTQNRQTVWASVQPLEAQ